MMKKFQYLTFLLLVIHLVSCISEAESTDKNQGLEKRTTPEVMPNCYNVAFLVMDGVYNTELTAPFDIFHHTIFRKNIKPMNVFTVANTNANHHICQSPHLKASFGYRFVDS